ncbi:hypothetical protein ACQ856_18170 [Mycolicibacterium psychrotolerans]|uniref:hypothetical protein n=1 Tax=Mycolicibacterium psychrotolerans TaxID=216929 RepID=UPI003D67E91C
MTGPAVPGMTRDTDPDNPVNAYPPNEFPVGAALTITYGSNERPFCTLGNLYRILGWLTGEIPDADEINTEIERCRTHVTAQLPDVLRLVDPPPAPGDDGDNTADMVWLIGITRTYGRTITLTALPDTINNPTGTDA